MLQQEIQCFAKSKGFHPHTVQRWLSWPPDDGAALLSIALALKAGENHLRDLMDWLEEIELRDSVSAHDILRSEAVEKISTDPRLGRADRLKRIKEQIRRRRFPRLAQLEDSIQSCIKELKLMPTVKLSVPPGLEGGDLRFEFTIVNSDDLKSIVRKLSEVAESRSLSEIFTLLKGGFNNAERKTADQTA